MVELAADEKSTMVMVYTQNSLVRGEFVTKEAMRVSILLRTDSAPRFLHVHNAQMISFNSGQARPANHSEVYVPVSSVIAFHIAPPAQEGLDYEADERNREETVIAAAVGAFIFKGRVRFSAQSGLAASLQMLTSWMSMYEVEVTNSIVPQMPVMRVPMLIVHPSQVTFAL